MIKMVEAGSFWNNGEEKTLTTITIPCPQVENVVKQYGAGDWLVQVSLSLKIHLEFSDGKPQELSCSPVGQFYFRSSGSTI